MKRGWGRSLKGMRECYADDLAGALEYRAAGLGVEGCSEVFCDAAFSVDGKLALGGLNVNNRRLAVGEGERAGG